METKKQSESYPIPELKWLGDLAKFIKEPTIENLGSIDVKNLKQENAKLSHIYWILNKNISKGYFVISPFF